MEINFCRRCGSSVTKKSDGYYLCQKGHELFYKNSGLAASLVLVDGEGRMLLATRAIQPGKGKLDIPGGFVDFGESLEQACAREIEEELGLTPADYGKPEYLVGALNTYPYGGEELYPYDVFFWARIKPGATFEPRDDISGAEWYDLAAFNTEQLAFMTARQAITLLKERVATHGN